MTKKKNKFAVSIWHGDSNIRINNSILGCKEIEWNILEFDDEIVAIKEFGNQIKKYAKLTEDCNHYWKFFEKCCARFDWIGFDTRVLTYIRLLKNYDDYNDFDDNLLD